MRNVAKQITSPSYVNKSLVGKNTGKNGFIASKTPKLRWIQATKSIVSRFHSKIWKNKVSITSIVSPSNRKYLQRWRSKGQPVRFQVDSGATCNVISKNDLPDECWIAHSKQVLSMFNGSKMETIGKCRVNLVNPKVDEECEAEFVVVNKDCTPLLSSKTVQEMKLIEVHYEKISLI